MEAIRLENVGKKFILSHPRDKAMGPALPSFSGNKIATEFWALRKMNMLIEKGKVVGIIGRNGAGKTTLLNILAGVSTPTRGKVEINGRVSSLLTLGAGFQDELTGKENIYLSSSILGISHDEINRKYPSIVEFSELDGFLNSPLQTYSQGMRLRLGFSVAVHADFDIFLIDEILSVGDVSFQKRCFDKIEEFRRQGKTMLITTQSLDIIERLCEEAFLLENGEVVESGHPQKVTARYLELLNEKKFSETFQRRYGKREKWWSDRRLWETREGSKEARIVAVNTYNARGKKTNQFKTGEKVTVKAYFVVKQEINEPHFGVAIFREDGVYCYGPNTFFDGHRVGKLKKGEGTFSIEYKSLLLKPGQYRFSLAIWDEHELWAYDYHVGFYKFAIIGKNKDSQLLNLKYKWQPDNLWQKFKMHQPEKPVMPFNPSEQWQDKISPFDVDISLVQILDSADSPKSVFRTGENLKIRLRLKFLKKRAQDYYVWIGLFRGDDIYCHAAAKEIKEEEIALIYPCLLLLTGDYYISLGIWRKSQSEPLFYKHKASSFKISFLGQDHGTVYLPHSWDWKFSKADKNNAR